MQCNVEKDVCVLLNNDSRCVCEGEVCVQLNIRNSDPRPDEQGRLTFTKCACVCKVCVHFNILTVL